MDRWYLEGFLIVLMVIIIYESIKYVYTKLTMPKKINVFKDFIYMDANSTTPMYDDVIQTWNDYAACGNASTDYSDQLIVVPAMLNTASALIRVWTNAPNYIVAWNSGASE